MYILKDVYMYQSYMNESSLFSHSLGVITHCIPFFIFLDLTYMSSSFQYSHLHFTAKETSSSFQTFLHSSHSFLVMQSKSVTAIILFFRGGPDWLYKFLHYAPCEFKGSCNFLRKSEIVIQLRPYAFTKKKKKRPPTIWHVWLHWYLSDGIILMGSALWGPMDPTGTNPLDQWQTRNFCLRGLTKKSDIDPQNP